MYIYIYILLIIKTNTNNNNNGNSNTHNSNNDNDSNDNNNDKQAYTRMCCGYCVVHVTYLHNNGRKTFVRTQMLSTKTAVRLRREDNTPTPMNTYLNLDITYR